MVFACSGKMRSTPCPKDTLRTVIVARAPAPRSPMTTPSKTWTRSRSVSLGLPLISSLTEVSLTRTWTRTVSPGVSCGRPFLRSPASMLSIGFIVLPLSLFQLRFSCEDLRLALDLGQQGGVLGGQPGPLDQVRPPLARGAQRFLAPPAADAAVVAGEEHLGHGVPAHHRRPGVMGEVQDPVGE